MASVVALLATAVAVALLFPMQFEVEAQQSYVNNKQLDCNQSPNTTLGFVCNSAAPSCTSFLTFRSTPVYNSPASIAYLLSADASQIAAFNEISDVAPLPADTLVVVPVNCSCSGPYLQHNASYVLKPPAGETYFSVANDTYQALSTCQALIAQNPFDPRQLLPGMRLTIPLRCACPTPNQTAAGFRYLLTYLVRLGNTYDSIAKEFAGAGADVDSILDANMLSQRDTFFYFAPLLVPLKTQPTKENINTTVASPPPPLPPPAVPTGDGGSNSNKWIFIGVGIGAAVLVLFSSVALAWFLRHRRRRSKSPPQNLKSSESMPPLSNWSEFPEGIRSAMETLTVYKLEDLENATNSFAESNRINGSSVYLASFKGDDAVVKVMKGDISREIDALRQINHSRVVRLSGFCLHQGTTYLVYEYVDNGSLAECLRRSSNSKHDSATKPLLDWKQRIQIACDVADALNYLHNFTNPPYIHKNLTTANILLDGSMRAKVANFGLARALNDSDKEAITRHVVGAQGYMAPEYIETGLITPKLDVFAFGVVMLELLSGREAVGDGSVLLFHTIEEVLSGENVREKLQGFMDKTLGEEYPLEQAYTMAQLARTCVAHNVDARPSVSDVLVALSALSAASLDGDPSHDTSISFSE